jgi:hypothetical protein
LLLTEQLACAGPLPDLQSSGRRLSSADDQTMGRTLLAGGYVSRAAGLHMSLAACCLHQASLLG